MLFVSLALLTAADVPPDLVALARAHRSPTFAQVANARFAAKDDTRYQAFKDWAKTIAPEERTDWARQPGEHNCALLESRGIARSMIATLDTVKDRTAAEHIWLEVEGAYANGTKTEQAMLAKARLEARTRPTALGAELAIRVASDQAWREAEFSGPDDSAAEEPIGWRLGAQMCRIDSANMVWLKTVVARDAWPLISRDGANAANDAWLLAQHADDDPAFQAKVLALMKPLVARKEAKGENYALLYDRVALAQKRPQRYATQFTSEGGCLHAEKTEDIANVDARRAAMGLPTLTDYVKTLSDAYHQTACKVIFQAG